MPGPLGGGELGRGTLGGSSEQGMRHGACKAHGDGGTTRDALEGKGPQRWLQKPLDRRLEEVAKAVGGGYCRLQMPLKPALGVRGTVAGHSLGALEGGGGTPPPLAMHPWGQRRRPRNLGTLAAKLQRPIPPHQMNGPPP